MQRYFVHADQFQKDHVILDGEDAHHLIRVMRAREGERLIVSDGNKREVIAEIIQIEQDRVITRMIDELAMDKEPAVHVTIAQSLPKGDKMEMVIQKGTEIGAVRFIPFVSDRTIVQYDERREAKRLDRWRKIAKEAAEQAQRNRVPEVDAVLSWNEMLQRTEQYDLALICYEQVQDTQGLRPILRRFRNQLGSVNDLRLLPNPPSILLIVGPEGGFTEREAQEAVRAGAHLTGLGNRILRTETAALVGLSCMMYEFDEMGYEEMEKS